MSTKKARGIIEYRAANGDFKSCNDLEKVNGIGKKTVEKLVGICTVGSGTTVASTPIAAPAPVGAVPAVADPTSVNAANGLININTATLDQLKAMGLSPAMAQKAIADRDANGAFKSCKDINALVPR